MNQPSSEKGKKPLPYALCLLVCEQVIVDDETKNRTAVGMFSDILAPTFPAVHPKLAVYIELTNGHGLCELQLRLVKTATNEALVALAGSVNFADPLHIAQLRFNFNGLVFKEPGEYRFQLFAENELLMERRMMVKQQPAATAQ